jgi:hypothetical protein
MKKNIAPILIVAVSALVIALTSFLYFTQEKEDTQKVSSGLPTKTTLFYSEECPHCRNIEAFIAKNNIIEKVQFDKVDAWDEKNSDVFLSVVVACNIPKDQAGIPLLWDNGTCYMGEPDVTSFFKQKAGIQ